MAKTTLDSQDMRLIQKASITSGWIIRNYCVSIFNLRTHELSSGSLIEIGTRLFVATARHVIPENPLRVLRILNRAGDYERDGFSGFLKWNRHFEPNKGVGYLELERETAIQYFGDHDFCRVNRIADLGVGRPDRTAIVIGTPARSVKPVETFDEINRLKYACIPYLTFPLPQHEWPGVFEEMPEPDEKIDVFLDYPKEECQIFETEESTTMPDTTGMSGGGVWDQGDHAEKVWFPGSCTLFAIQESCCPHRRSLRATQIKHWIDLILRDYPDLRPELEKFRDTR